MTGWFRLVRREARGDLPLLACLAVVVAVIAGIAAVGPVALAGREDQALRQRVATAAQAGPAVTVSTKVNRFDDPFQEAQAGPLLQQTAPAEQRIARTAALPAGSSLDLVRTEVDYPLTKVVTPVTRINHIVSTSLVPRHVSDAAAHLRYVSGGAPAARTPAGAFPGIGLSQAAATLTGLKVGEHIHVLVLLQPVVYADFTVSGIFRPIDPDDGFWRDQPQLDQPVSYPDGTRAAGNEVSFQGLIGADAPAVLKADGIPLPTVTWEFGVGLGHDAVHRAAGAVDALRALPLALAARMCATVDPRGQPLCTMGTVRSGPYGVTDSFTPLVGAFTAEDGQTRELASFAVASLLAVALATTVVAVRLLLRRRGGHLALQRSRGASTTGLVLLRTAITTPALLVAAALGWLLGLRLAPGGTSGAPQPLIALVGAGVAVLLVPLLSWQAVREPAGGRESRRDRRGRGRGRRVVAESTAVLLAVAATVALRARGTGAGTGVDVQLSLAPVLIALVAVLLLVRVYPLVLRLPAVQARRGGGTVAFVGLRRAAQDAPSTSLALFVLVITLGTAVFGGLVTRSVQDGSVVGAAWATGGDAVVLQTGNVTPAPVRTTGGSPVGAVLAEYGRGVRLVDDDEGEVLADGELITVDPARLAAVEPGSPLVRALSVLSAGGGAPVRTGPLDLRIPVLTDPELYAQGAHASLTLTVDASLPPGDRKLHPRPVGVLDAAALSDPALGPIVGALPDGTRIMIASTAADPVLPGQPSGSTALLVYARTGADPRAAAALAADALGPLAEVRVRADRLAQLRGDGLARLVDLSYTGCTLLALLFGLLAVALELVLTSRERGRTSSYLRTLGLGSRSTTVLQVVQLLPMAVAAAVGGTLVGVLEPRLLGPLLNLRQFTGGPTGPALHTDYPLTLALGAALALLVLGAALVESSVARSRRLGAVLRLGEV
ncbi:hypothetical protein [Streptacidiphilus sp. PAMC 29251]